MAFVLSFVGYFIGRCSAESKLYDVRDHRLPLLEPVQFYDEGDLGEPKQRGVATVRSMYFTTILTDLPCLHSSHGPDPPSSSSSPDRAHGHPQAGGRPSDHDVSVERCVCDASAAQI
jgi:hypothetical protein